MSKLLADRIYDVFISHVFEEADAARRLRDVLARAGWKCFLAVDDISAQTGSAEWSRNVDEALDQSGAITVLVSPASIDSQWVEYEWRSVHNDILAGRPGLVIPCCVREIGPEDLPRALRRYQSIDLRDSKQRQAEYNKLLDLIEAFLKTPAQQVADRQLRRVLAIDGGGVRVLAAARVLQHLETVIGQIVGKDIELGNYFDMVAGSSSGGVLAALLALPGMRASAAYEILLETFPHLFKKRSVLRRFTKGLYKSEPLRDALEVGFGEARMSDLSKSCLVPVYDLSSDAPLLLSGDRAKRDSNMDIPVIDAVMGSVAAPTMFPPHQVSMPSDRNALLIDGALFAKNPTGLAIEELRNEIVPRPLAGDICVLSVGTREHITIDGDPRSWNIIRWIPTIINIALDASAALTHKNLLQSYNALGLARQYLRIEADLTMPEQQFIKYDRTDRKAINALRNIGDALIEQYAEEIDEFANFLVNRKPRTPEQKE